LTLNNGAPEEAGIDEFVGATQGELLELIAAKVG